MNRIGSIAVPRHGFKCLGRRLHVALFKVAHKMNPGMNSRHQANRLGITRQLRYQTGSNRSVDVVLSLNGIPVVTMELRNPLAGQTFKDAQRQYRLDRDPDAITEVSPGSLGASRRPPETHRRRAAAPATRAFRRVGLASLGSRRLGDRTPVRRASFGRDRAGRKGIEDVHA